MYVRVVDCGRPWTRHAIPRGFKRRFFAIASWFVRNLRARLRVLNVGTMTMKCVCVTRFLGFSRQQEYPQPMNLGKSAQNLHLPRSMTRIEGLCTAGTGLEGAATGIGGGLA